MLLPLPDQASVAALLRRCTFPESGTAVVCGVSGGADSSALLVLASLAELKITATHVDHGLRPQNSEADSVADLAARFGAEFRSVQLAVAPGSNFEERARAARHRALGSDFMTGHTADDQAETMLINLLRGSGLRGLGAMRPGVRHPILALRRFETEWVCAEFGIEPFADPTNLSAAHVRNRVRHELLPLMAEISGRDPVPLLDRTSGLARSAEDVLAQLGEGLLVDGLPIPTPQLQKAAQPLRISALRTWIHAETGRMPSRQDVLAVEEVVFHRARATQISGGWRVMRSGGQLSLRGAG